MLEALWSVSFISNVEGFGSGVAVLDTGRVLGGDAQRFYVGSYNVENGIANATVTVTPCAGPSMTLFGHAKKLTLKLTGKPERSEFALQGFVVENPALNSRIHFTRLAELPQCGHHHPGSQHGCRAITPYSAGDFFLERQNRPSLRPLPIGR